MNHCRWLVMVGCLLGMTGCATWTTSDKPKTKKESSWFPWGKKEYQIPQSMAAIWTEDILNVPGKQATRGFGGRIYFYNEKSQAIPVEGELIVYGYDESVPKHPNDMSIEADKKFRFTSEQFTQHFSQSDLGASYSVWIPWDNGGFHKKIMLIPSFITADGRLIRGEPSKMTLSGKSRTTEDQYPPSMIQQASHLEPTNSSPLPRLDASSFADNQMKTTTIQLPSGRRAPSKSSAIQPTSASLNSSAGLPTTVSYGNGLSADQLQSRINMMQGLGAGGGELQRLMLEAQLKSLPSNTPSSSGSLPTQPGLGIPSGMGQPYTQGQATGLGRPMGVGQSTGLGQSSTVPQNAWTAQPMINSGAMPGNPAAENGFGVQPMAVTHRPMPPTANQAFQTSSMSSSGAMPAPTTGFANPGFPQMDWSALSSRSVWNSPQVQNGSAVPPASYPPR